MSVAMGAPQRLDHTSSCGHCSEYSGLGTGRGNRKPAGRLSGSVDRRLRYMTACTARTRVTARHMRLHLAWLAFS
jgi:hypothetical protein